MQRHVKSCLLVVAAMVPVLCGGTARATTIIDQQNAIFEGGNAQPLDRIAQTFTASAAGIDFARFSLGTDGPMTFRLDLRAGTGFFGSLLGSSVPVTVDIPDFEPVEFGFANTIALTPGNKYTLSLVRVGGGTFYAHMSMANPYAGGNVYAGYYNGTSMPAFDLIFAEGRRIAAVPEPTVWAMLVGGFGLVGGAMRRRPVRTVRFA